MIPPPFEYAAPKTTSEAINLLRQDSNAKVLAGGQSLIPMMRFRLASPALLIDINRIGGLDYIREEDGWLKIGAMTREVDLDRSDLVRRKYDLLADTNSGHNIVGTVFVQCRSMHRASGPEAFRPVGETEFVNGVAAMSASGGYGKAKICAGIVGHVDLNNGAKSRAVLEAHIRAGGDHQ